nr:MAG TPA: Baseplate component [Bacteriophage sp.]
MIQHIIPVYFLRDGIQARIEMVQGDSGREVLFSAQDIVITSDMSAKIYVEKPSGLSSYRNAEIRDNSVSVKVTTQMLAETGTCLGQIQIYRETEKVTSFLFRLEVKKSIVNASGIESKDEFTILEQTIQEAIAAIKDATDAKNAAADAAKKALQAAATADASTSNADLKALEAQRAADDAAAAAGRADTAAGKATTEAEKATTAASNANTVYEKLKDISVEQINDDISSIKSTLNKTIIVEG